ncbi:hypothetical protein ACWCWD_29580 [Streptomyces sp. NPDC001493]
MPIPKVPDVFSDPSEDGGDWTIRKSLAHGEHELSTPLGPHGRERVSFQSLGRAAMGEFVPALMDRLGVGLGEDPHHPSRLAHGE